MIIDGKKLAEEVLVELASQVKKFSKLIKLAGVLVGNFPGSRKFLELKKKAAEKIGITFEIKSFAEDINKADFKKNLLEICQDPLVTGVIIELPLPKHLNTREFLNLIPVEKDIDVLSREAQENFFVNRSKILPPTVEAVKIILEKYGVDPKGKNCTIFGHGLLVGKPVSHWLATQGAVIQVVDEFTKNPENFSRTADIIISGVGKSGLVTGEMIKDGAVVIDFGYENIEGRIQGDVNFEEVSRKAALITPVPGGVGPLVVAAVLKNSVILAQSTNR